MYTLYPGNSPLCQEGLGLSFLYSALSLRPSCRDCKPPLDKFRELDIYSSTVSRDSPSRRASPESPSSMVPNTSNTESPTACSPSISPASSPASLVASTALPTPGVATLFQDPPFKKKSHAKKQPPGHIPRPRNAFILFRCDFVHQKKVPEAVEHDHRNISRIAGKIWKGMSAEEKRPWVDMAEVEKQCHAQKYPGYRYNPTAFHSSSGSKSGERGRKRRMKEEKEEPKIKKEEGVDDGLLSPLVHERQYPDVAEAFTLFPSPEISMQFPHRRSSSCPPPGSVPVPNYTPLDFHPMMTQDDLAGRRPSRTTMYHSQPIRPTFVSNTQGVIEPPTWTPWLDARAPFPWTDLNLGAGPSSGANLQPLASNFPFTELNREPDYTTQMSNLTLDNSPFNNPFEAQPIAAPLLTNYAFQPSPNPLSPLDRGATEFSQDMPILSHFANSDSFVFPDTPGQGPSSGVESFSSDAFQAYENPSHYANAGDPSFLPPGIFEGFDQQYCNYSTASLDTNSPSS